MAALLLLGSGASAAQPEVDAGGEVYDTLPVERLDGPTQLDPVQVMGANEALPRYVPDSGRSATKTDTPLIETPQSVSVITGERMRDLGAMTLQDALHYGAGVRSDAYGLDSRADSAVIRGTTFVQYQDGLRALYGNFNNVRPDPWALDSVEVVRGPASVLYGQGSSGGTVNLNSKRPRAETSHELRLQLGSHDRRQIGLDSTGSLTDSGRWQYRLVALGRESETQVDFVRDDRWFVTPSLSWVPSDRFRWTVFGHFQQDESGSTTAFLPWEGTVLPSRNGFVPTERFVSEPGFDRYDTEQSAVTSLLEWRLGEAFTLRQHLRYVDSSAVYQGMFPNIYTGDPFLLDPLQRRRVLRLAHSSLVDTQAITVDQHLSARWQWGAVEQQWLIGVDASRARIDEISGRSSVAEVLLQGRFDLYEPSYGRYIAPQMAEQPGLTMRQTGVYLQDQIRFGQRWIALLGARHDRAKSEVEGSAPVEDAETSMRAGLLYRGDRGWSPYLSYSESFQPVTSVVDADGQPFRPVRGRQHEAGVKFQPGAGNTLLTLAVFEIEEKNRLAPGPNPLEQVQLGMARIRGAEVELAARWGESLDLLASYTWLDAYSDEGEAAGEARFKNLAATPPQFAALWARWQFSLFGRPGFSVGAGVRYTDAIPDQSGTVEVPSTTLFDAMVAFEAGSWRLAVNGTNLADQRVVSDCIERGDCFYGPRRNVVGSLSYRFH